MTKSGDSKSSVYYGFHSLLDLTTPLHIIAELSLSDEPLGEGDVGSDRSFSSVWGRRKARLDPQDWSKWEFIDPRSMAEGKDEKWIRVRNKSRLSAKCFSNLTAIVRGSHIWCQRAPVAIYEDDYEHEKAGSINDDRYERLSIIRRCEEE